jgi:hypothetical protein
LVEAIVSTKARHDRRAVHRGSDPICAREASREVPQGEAEEYFKETQRLAVDSNAPKEVQELGRVIQHVMLGDKNVDLSGLPEAWAEAVERTVHEYDHE